MINKKSNNGEQVISKTGQFTSKNIQIETNNEYLSDIDVLEKNDNRIIQNTKDSLLHATT